MEEKRPDGKAAIVAGAARGIGAAIARRLAADGAKVVANYGTSAGPAEQFIAAIQTAEGEAVAVQADVGDPAAVGRLFDAAEAAFGPMAVLVNNAGVFKTRGVERQDAAHYDKVLRANVLAVLLTTAEFAGRFRGDGGHIADVVAFLCSRDGRWVTGQFLDANVGCGSEPPTFRGGLRCRQRFWSPGRPA